MKRASIQLSINFLVVIILSIVLLGIGLSFMVKVTQTGQKWDAQVTKYNQEKLAKNLNSGELISVFPRVKTVERGELAIFALGISNELANTQGYVDFYFNVELSAGQSGDEPELLYVKGPFKIDANNRRIDIPLGINVKKSTGSGEWLYNIKVCKDDDDCREENSYGKMQKIQVNVR